MKKYLLGLAVVGLLAGAVRAEYTVEVVTGNVVKITEVSSVGDGTNTYSRPAVNKTAEIVSLSSKQNDLDQQIANLDQQIANWNIQVSNCVARKADLKNTKDALQAKIDALTAAQ